MNKTTINYKKLVESEIRKAWRVYGYDPLFTKAQKEFKVILNKGEKLGDYKPNATQLAILNGIANIVFVDPINNKWQALSNNKQKEFFEIATIRAIKTSLKLDRSTMKNDLREYELTSESNLQPTLVQLGYILATDNGTKTIKIKNQKM